MADTVAGTPPYRTLGGIYHAGGTTFRVWAPEARRVDLVIEPPGDAIDPVAGPPPPPARRRSVRPLRRHDDGHWSGRFDDVRPGTLYRYRLDEDDGRIFPDPASRFQPYGVHGPSQVVDPSAFEWTDDDWRPPRLEECVFYELHIGTFTPGGSFRAAIERLPHLVDLGVTAVELMPLADFPGERNWGYDGVALYAPARCYGTPDDLRALVDRAHRLGLAVVLDVVYNHFGPDGAYANAFSPYYFTDRHRSPWGRGVNLDGPHSAPVRRFFLENALHWLDEYHIDGLRLDATHALEDGSATHFLAELSDTVRAHARRRVLLVAEDDRNLRQLVLSRGAGGFGLDAVWADDFHHQARVHAAGDREGYYMDFTGTTADLAATIRQGWFFTGQYSRYRRAPRGTDPADLRPEQFVICIQNHDQVGNRADGARLNHEIEPAVYRALSALLLLAPQTPLLFMGQEWATGSPFQFFTDHHAELGRLVTEGRREEFRAFSAFRDPAARARIPDPQDPATFLRSRLRWDEPARAPHDGVLRLYRRLLALRRTEPLLRRRVPYTAWAPDAHTVAVMYGLEPRQQRLLVLARLSGEQDRVGIDGEIEEVLLTTEDEAFCTDARAVAIARGSVSFPRPAAAVVRVRPGE